MNYSKNKIIFIILDHYKTERLGIQILSSIALEEEYERDLLIINSMSIEEGLKKVRDFHPQIVAYSGMTYEQFDLQQFNMLLKKSNLKFISIFGGQHYTFNPEEIIKDNNIDVICRGEGEEAFRKFIQAVRDVKEYDHIEKLWVRRGNEIIKNPLGTLNTNLDSIPFPDRDLLLVCDLETDRYQGKSMSVMIGRGCPQRCSYCFNHKYNELFRGSKIFRYRSVNSAIKETKQIVKKYGLDFIIFVDDCFSYLPNEFIKEFCQKYKDEIGIPFFVQFRAETVREDIVVMLKEAGLHLASISVECGNEDVSHNILQRGIITNDHLSRACELFHKHKIKTWSLNLLALPVENPLEIDLETIKFNIKIKPTWALFSILIPIPNTSIWDYSIQHGYLDKDSILDPNKPPSTFTGTRLKYKDPDLVKKVNNLHKFASIVVKFPFLLPLVKILIRFPENRIYQYISFIWYGYWKTIGSFQTKFSFRLVINGIKSINKYLSKH
ncbi:B12-binding domain-containing radical SAM protein [Patescibacteria group bacterium]|nr:B12-binding domain-containing radical SAM protein [Patescibacteria group bacterium]